MRVYSLLHPTPKPVTEFPIMILYSNLSISSSFTILVMTYVIPRPFFPVANPVWIGLLSSQRAALRFLLSDPVTL